MSMHVIADFVLKSGATEQLRWAEENPRLIQKDKETGEIVREIPLSADELKREIMRKLVTDKKPFVVEGVNGEVYYVDLTEVAFIRVKVEESDKRLELIGTV